MAAWATWRSKRRRKRSATTGQKCARIGDGLQDEVILRPLWVRIAASPRGLRVQDHGAHLGEAERERRAAIAGGTAPADLTVTGLAKALPYSWAAAAFGRRHPRTYDRCRRRRHV